MTFWSEAHWRGAVAQKMFAAALRDAVEEAGRSLSEWAERHGLPFSTVRKALKGDQQMDAAIMVAAVMDFGSDMPSWEEIAEQIDAAAKLKDFPGDGEFEKLSGLALRTGQALASLQMQNLRADHGLRVRARFQVELVVADTAAGLPPVVAAFPDDDADVGIIVLGDNWEVLQSENPIPGQFVVSYDELDERRRPVTVHVLGIDHDEVEGGLVYVARWAAVDWSAGPPTVTILD
ncbi:MAG TPA: hypothetical protein VFP54_06005 [Acidimicrobiales bacterium]|nr:hypothetical protein [Acidimicrobiales bacterium]